MVVFRSFHSLRMLNLRLINTARIILIPKKDGLDRVQDYNPINLMYGLEKWISKTLALQLALHLNNLVSQNQSAFVKTRSIQDDYLYVQNLLRRLHRSKTSMGLPV